jgi:hypothetical protein
MVDPVRLGDVFDVQIVHGVRIGIALQADTEGVAIRPRDRWFAATRHCGHGVTTRNEQPTHCHAPFSTRRRLTMIESTTDNSNTPVLTQPSSSACCELC